MGTCIGCNGTIDRSQETFQSVLWYLCGILNSIFSPQSCLSSNKRKILDIFILAVRVKLLGIKQTFTKNYITVSLLLEKNDELNLVSASTKDSLSF